MTDLDSDEYDWRQRLSHTNMTGGALGKHDWRRRLRGGALILSGLLIFKRIILLLPQKNEIIGTHEISFKFPNSAQPLEQSSAQQDERIKRVHRLQQEIPTHWSSCLVMMKSLLQTKQEVENGLKLIGH